INGTEPSAATNSRGEEVPAIVAARRLIFEASHQGVLRLQTSDGSIVRIILPQVPTWSVPVHPTQIYASVNAFLLFAFAALYYPSRRRDGEVIALTLGVYAITRYLLELIRTDELSFADTGLTISQNVSLAIFALALAGLFYLRRLPAKTVWPLASTQATGN
ncbi:MAG: prolipoprotein diacylglyceryl transferase family protein, partial [Blastopirellula sp. JB062]